MRTKQQKDAYDQEYKKRYYKRIPLDVRMEYVNTLKKAAELDGLPFNTWIKSLMETRCKELGLTFPEE